MGNNARIRKQEKAAKKAAARDAARAKRKLAIEALEQRRLASRMPLRRRLFQVATWAIATIVGVVGFVGAIDGIFGPPWPTAPDIGVQSAPVDDPFSAYFSLRNPSTIFPIKAIDFSCGLVSVVGLLSFRGMSVEDGTIIGFNIAPTATIQAACPINKIFGQAGKSYESARIFVVVTYRFFDSQPRLTVSKEFTWDSTSKQWIEGKRLN